MSLFHKLFLKERKSLSCPHAYAHVCDVFVFMFVWVYTYACACACADLSLNLEITGLAELAGQQALGSLLPLPPLPHLTVMCHHA